MRHQATRQPEPPVHRRSSRWTVGLICWAILGGTAQAQQKPDTRKRAPNPVTKRKTGPRAHLTPNMPRNVKTDRKDARKKSIKGVRKAPNRKPKLTPDPDAKWSCDTTAVTLDPIWRGKKDLTFNFHIRNTGRADLKYIARGG